MASSPEGRSERPVEPSPGLAEPSQAPIGGPETPDPTDRPGLARSSEHPASQCPIRRGLVEPDPSPAGTAPARSWTMGLSAHVRRAGIARSGRERSVRRTFAALGRAGVGCRHARGRPGSAADVGADRSRVGFEPWRLDERSRIDPQPEDERIRASQRAVPGRARQDRRRATPRRSSSPPSDQAMTAPPSRAGPTALTERGAAPPPIDGHAARADLAISRSAHQRIPPDSGAAGCRTSSRGLGDYPIRRRRRPAGANSSRCRRATAAIE